MTALSTELVPCSAESLTAAKRPPSTRYRKHAFARLSSNKGAGTRAHGHSPRLSPITSEDPGAKHGPTIHT